MRPISTNTSDFEALRKAGQAYVDKPAIWLIGLSFDSKMRHLADCAWSCDA